MQYSDNMAIHPASMAPIAPASHLNAPPRIPAGPSSPADNQKGAQAKDRGMYGGASAIVSRQYGPGF